MEKKDIKYLVDYIASHSELEEVDIKTESLKLRVKKRPRGIVSSTQVVTPVIETLQAPTQAAPPPRQEVKETVEEVPKASEELTPIKSTLIGTFYTSQNPESPPFVKVGDKIKKGQVLCVIEAMKLFNEITSDIEGEVVEICVENANPVEYEQDLFLLKT